MSANCCFFSFANNGCSSNSNDQLKILKQQEQSEDIYRNLSASNSISKLSLAGLKQSKQHHMLKNNSFDRLNTITTDIKLNPNPISSNRNKPNPILKKNQIRSFQNQFVLPSNFKSPQRQTQPHVHHFNSCYHQFRQSHNIPIWKQKYPSPNLAVPFVLIPEKQVNNQLKSPFNQIITITKTEYQNHNLKKNLKQNTQPANIIIQLSNQSLISSKELRQYQDKPLIKTSDIQTHFIQQSLDNRQLSDGFRQVISVIGTQQNIASSVIIQSPFRLQSQRRADQQNTKPFQGKRLSLFATSQNRLPLTQS